MLRLLLLSLALIAIRGLGHGELRSLSFRRDHFKLLDLPGVSVRLGFDNVLALDERRVDFVPREVLERASLVEDIFLLDGELRVVEVFLSKLYLLFDGS